MDNNNIAPGTLRERRPRRRLIIFSLLAVVLGCALVFGVLVYQDIQLRQTAQNTGGEAPLDDNRLFRSYLTDTKYLPDVADRLLVEDPATFGPEVTEYDLEHYRALMATRNSTSTSKEVAQDQLYKASFGPYPYELIAVAATEDEDPLAALYQRADDELKRAAEALAVRYPRPYFDDRAPEVESLASYSFPIASPAYPSYRAAEAFLVAGLFTLFDPERAEDYERDAYAYALRGIGYGHYAISDLEAGRSLAQQFLELLPESEAFLNDFEAAKPVFEAKVARHAEWLKQAAAENEAAIEETAVESVPTDIGEPAAANEGGAQ